MAVTSEDLTLRVVLSAEQLDALAERVAEVIEGRWDDGFVGVEGAAAFLSCSPQAIYHLVGRGHLPHHHAGRRLLFDRRELRTWAERGKG